jgi:hypothetical protein
MSICCGLIAVTAELLDDVSHHSFMSQVRRRDQRCGAILVYLIDVCTILLDQDPHNIDIAQTSGAYQTNSVGQMDALPSP